jgi:ubiquinone/menaquinone biosynthesis C-methylase UbiE
MPSEKQVYESDAERYERLIRREDFRGNIQRALENIFTAAGADVLDLGAGTGRLTEMLAPQARRIFAFDLSAHMLALTREKLKRLAPSRGLAAVADHCFLPLPAAIADVIVSGWSVSYLAVWNPERWRLLLDAWLAEAKRVLRMGGMIVLLESLGTGNEAPHHLPHLENVYYWLEQNDFASTWIRTDYRFESLEEAVELSDFFFGEEMAAQVLRQHLVILPECTGIWWKRV